MTCLFSVSLARQNATIDACCCAETVDTAIKVANAATAARGIQFLSFDMALSLQGVTTIRQGNPV